MSVSTRTDIPGTEISTPVGHIRLKHLLGKGKSGYSWLADSKSGPVVFKRMHDEPCPYYDFGGRNKVELEQSAYRRLRALDIQVSRLLATNASDHYLIKEYIDGTLATEQIIHGTLDKSILRQLFTLSRHCRQHQINLDWFPDNFIVRDGVLHYIDYEFNPYDQRWDWPHWGLYYWLNGAGMAAFKRSGDAAHINQPPESGMPIRGPFEQRVHELIAQFMGQERPMRPA